MARTNYQRGYETELKIMKELADRGFLVLRSAGSHSKIDVIGLRKDRIVAVQSKRTKVFSWASYRKEVEAIQEIIRVYELDNVDFELWVWEDRKGFKKWRIIREEIKEVV
jgi:Holliday junction resolvase